MTGCAGVTCTVTESQSPGSQGARCRTQPHFTTSGVLERVTRQESHVLDLLYHFLVLWCRLVRDLLLRAAVALRMPFDLSLFRWLHLDELRSTRGGGSGEGVSLGDRTPSGHPIRDRGKISTLTLRLPVGEL